MKTRKLGQGLEVSAMGLGCMGMSEFYGAARRRRVDRDDPRARSTLGVNFLDTADMYGPVHQRRAASGSAIQGRRDQVVLATKFGIVRGPKPHGTAASTAGPSTCSACCDAQPEAPRRRHASTSTTSTASIRRRRSRRRSARWRSWCRRARCATSGCRRPRRRRSAARHAVHPIAALQSGVFALEPRRRGRDPRRPAASSASASCPTARSGAAS